MKSPYENVDSSKWLEITQQLLNDFPLSKDYLVSLVLKSWNTILETKIADKWSIAYDIKPKPQIMGFFLHEIIGQYIQVDYSDSWRKDTDSLPKIRLIRFGWLDHTDWIGQSAASGQQARLPKEVEKGKLIIIYKS